MASTPEPPARGTPIREYNPDFDESDYAALARIRDEIHASMADTTPKQPAAAGETRPQRPGRKPA